MTVRWLVSCCSDRGGQRERGDRGVAAAPGRRPHWRRATLRHPRGRLPHCRAAHRPPQHQVRFERCTVYVTVARPSVCLSRRSIASRFAAAWARAADIDCYSCRHRVYRLSVDICCPRRTTWVSQYKKGKTSLDLNEARDAVDAVASAEPHANSLHLAPDR